MPNTEQTQTNESLDAWEVFGRTTKIQSWVDELTQMKDAEPTANDWRLAGRAVMICHPTEDLRKPLVKKIAHEAGYAYLWLSGENFFDLVNENKPLPGTAPTIIHIEQGVWCGKIEDDKKAAEELADFQRNDLPKYFAALPADIRVVFVVTGESYTELDPAIRSVGCFDRRFDIAPPTLTELGDWFLNQIGLAICDASLISDKGRVGKLVNDEFEDRRRQELIALHMQRLAHRKCRLLTYDDLVYFAVYGGSEAEHVPEDDPAMLYRIAVHEAGHALVSIIDSNGRNMPDYCSILPGSYFKGIVADSYAYCHALTGKYTYEDSRHKIRTQLAGRVAEAVVFGPTKVGTFGARSDLRNATTWAKELVGICGFSAEQENPDAIRDNLAVIDDDPSDSETAHIETQTRLLLKRQYEAVEQIIFDHKQLLDSITHALLENKVLGPKELSSLLKEIQRGNPKDPTFNRTSSFTGINPLLSKVVDHMGGAYSLEAQGILRPEVSALSVNTRDQLAAYIENQRNNGILIYALNKAPLRYTVNILSICSGIPVERLIGDSAQTESDFEKVCTALGKLHESPIYFEDTPDLSSEERLEGLFRLERTMDAKKLGFVICDQSTLLDDRFRKYCATNGIEIVILEQ